MRVAIINLLQFAKLQFNLNIIIINVLRIQCYTCTNYVHDIVQIMYVWCRTFTDLHLINALTLCMHIIL